jgi:hypothetical protein
VATVRHYRSLDLGTFNQRRTKLDGVTGAHCEHLVKSDFGSNVSRYLFYFEFFAISSTRTGRIRLPPALIMYSAI